MAFPDQIGTDAQTDTTTSPHTVNIPSSIVSGETVIAYATSDGASGQTFSWPAGWNELYDDQEQLAVTSSAAWHKGTGSEGSTIEVTTAVDEDIAWIVRRYTGAADPATTPPEIGGSLGQGQSSAPQPSTCTPTGGAKDYYWEATAHVDRRTINTYPTNQTLNQLENNAGGGSGGATVAVAGRKLNASSLAVGVWAISVTDQWLAYTIAIHPGAAGPTEVTLTSTMVGTALFQRQVGKTAAATQIGVPLFQRSITKTLAATQTGVARLKRGLFETLAATMVGVAGLVRLAATSIIMAATQIGVALFGIQVGKGMSGTAVPTPAFQKDVTKTATATVVASPAIQKQVSKTLTAVITGTAALSATLVFLINLVATMTGVAFILKRVGVGMPATATLTPAIQRQVGKSLRATAVGVAAFQLQVGKILRATQIGVAGLVASAGNTVAMVATMIGVPKIQRQMSKTLAATMIAAMTIQKAVALTLRATALVIGTIGTTGPGPAVAEEGKRIWYKGLFGALGKMRK